MSELQLENKLKHWYRNSKQQHRLDGQQRLALQKLVLTERAPSQPVDWQRGVQQMVALAACILVLVVWLSPQQLMYQIEQQQQGLYTIQIHQLAPVAAQQPPQSESSGSAAQQRQQQYQLVYQDYLRSQQQVARTVAVWRESTAEGWQLQSCEHLQVQVQADLLAALQQQTDQMQWQQLEQSRYMLLSIGAQGQILALKPGIEPPHCAI
jgi:hypothetical protein